jgi:ubiquinone/menaquinone biosynthesis C-methylase UbiE
VTSNEVNESVQSVAKYWNEHPVHSVEFPEGFGTRAHFDSIDKLRWSDNERWAEKTFYDLPGDGRTKLLDAGCGMGVFTRYYARKGFDVDAVDLTENAVRLTTESLRLFGLKARVRQASVESLPFPDDTFDYIVSNGVIHHTPETEKAVAEFFRVLKPGGRASVCIYYKNAALRWPLWPLARLVLRLALVKSSGRGKMLVARTPEELARVYDGDDTPIAKIYTKAESDRLFSAFKTVAVEPHYFPARFLRFFKPGGLVHGLLDRNFGFLIYYLLEKPR